MRQIMQPSSRMTTQEAAKLGRSPDEGLVAAREAARSETGVTELFK